MIDNGEKIPINVVGSSKFGRYAKISAEKTYNMFISDEWLVDYAGFQKILDFYTSDTGSQGRALFYSIRGQFMIAVASSGVFRISPANGVTFIGNINSVQGEVFIDENLAQQICIVDGVDAWIYDYEDTKTLTKQTLTNSLGQPIIPNYVCYHNSFFLIASSPNAVNAQNWFAATKDGTDSTSIIVDPADNFALQTKPDNAIAVKRIPGRGNNVIVFGSTVAEIWTQVGGTQNYSRAQSQNIDSGCVSVATIAASEDFVCWLAQNENNAPAIMVTDGGGAQRISTDGIDYLLQTIQRPDQSTAFFFRQDGHLFYQLTFFNEVDDLSLIYDFNTKQFFHVSNEDLKFHPARQVVYFNEKSFFVSIRDASLYEMSTNYWGYNYSTDTTAQPDEIPRIRVCNTIRRDDNSRFRVGYLTFWLEQGVNEFYRPIDSNTVVCNGLLIMEEGSPFIITEDGDNILIETGVCANVDNFVPRVDLSFSKNGNQSFSNIVSRDLNPSGHYKNRINWYRMGYCNEFTPQFRFWGLQRFVAQNGIVEVF